MKKFFGVLLLVCFCLACTSKSAKAEIEQFDRIVFDKLKTFNFAGEQLNFTLEGKADGEDVSTSGIYNSNGLTFHTSNFKKVQSYQIDREILKKIIFYWEDMVGDE